MKGPRRTWWREAFVDALLAALAEGAVAALGWTIRKVRKWWRKRQRKNTEDG
jgi:hypothetical protein